MGVVMLFVVSLLVSARLGVQAHRMYDLADSLRSQNDARERKIAEIKSKCDEMRVEIAAMKTPYGIEYNARKQGWLLPGEVSIPLNKR